MSNPSLHQSINSISHRVTRGAMALLGAGTLCASGAYAAEAAQRIPLTSYEGKQHTINVSVAGKPRTLPFDTGEGVTMISPSMARDIGCSPWGNEVGFRMLGERFEAPRCDEVAFDIARLKFSARTTFVYDISKLTGPSAPAIDGAIGMDLFDRQILTLDYASNALVLENDASALERTASLVEVPLRVTRYANGGIDIFIGVKTGPGLAWMTLDSANAGPTIFVSPAMATHLGLQTDRRDPQAVELHWTDLLNFRGFARVFPNMIMDGNIGMQLGAKRVVTLDLKNDRAWISATPTD